MDWKAIENETIEDLRRLLRFETVNPPGDEGPMAEYLVRRLEEAGLAPQVLTSEGRPNVVVRLAGEGAKARQGALLLTGHMDVVPVEAERWTHPPFEAVVEGEYLYGRGAIDMKNMVAMCLMVARQLAIQKVSLRRDLIVAFVSDEEEGCRHGSRFLVEEHPELVRAECLIGEAGAFSMDIKGKRYYPIQVAEKGRCRIRLTASGDPGHGSIPHKNNAIVHLAEALCTLGHCRLPQHRVRTVERFVGELARTQGFPASLILPRLLDSRLSGGILATVLKGSAGNSMAANLSNTVSPTILDAGEKINVIPASAEALLDGRLLPGQSGDDLMAELRALVGTDSIDIAKIEEHPGRENRGEHPLFGVLCETLRKHDPSGIPIPYLMPGFSDASQFGRIVPTCYGFSPVRFPREDQVEFSMLPHAHDERIHLPGFTWGLRVLWDAVKKWCGG